MGKGAKNRVTARRTAREKNAGKWKNGPGQSPRVFTPAFFSCLSPLSERLGQASGLRDSPRVLQASDQSSLFTGGQSKGRHKLQGHHPRLRTPQMRQEQT